MRPTNKEPTGPNLCVKSMVTKASQSVTYDFDEILLLSELHTLHNEKDPVTKSDDSFISVSDDQSFDDIDSQKNEYAAKCPLSDEGIILLEKKLEQKFDGLLPESRSALKAILRGDSDELNFSKRKLMAVLPTLIAEEQIQCIDNPEWHDFIRKLNDWQTAFHHSERTDLQRVDDQTFREILIKASGAGHPAFDQILAETVFFADTKNNRLIIRHACSEETNDLERSRAKLIRAEITKQILQSVRKPNCDSVFEIHHICPTIIDSLVEKHIVLKLINQQSDKEIIFNTKRSLNFGHICLAIQKMSNLEDCGRYVTIMSAIAFNILGTKADKTPEAFTNEDFTSYSALIMAHNFKEHADLKKLLNTLNSMDKTKQNLEAEQLVKFYELNNEATLAYKQLENEMISFFNTATASESVSRKTMQFSNATRTAVGRVLSVFNIFSLHPSSDSDAATASKAASSDDETCAPERASPPH